MNFIPALISCLLFIVAAVPRNTWAATDYHIVGWANTLIPGAGQFMLGRPAEGAFQFAYETSTFTTGYILSNGATFTLDGFVAPTPTRRLRRTDEMGIERNMAGDMLQEFGIKAHMVNTYEAYRLAARNDEGKLPDGFDNSSAFELFTAPLDRANLSDPWVYAPIGAVFTYCFIDYLTQLRSQSTVSRLNPQSNFLYSMNYGIWQPLGSGAPEEMFYRGFLQNEFKGWTGSPYAAILMSSAAFAFSHASNGRLTAAIAGGYLGFLAEKGHGQLGNGITVHFWSDMLLGLETILLYSKAQRATPPAGFSVQINY